MTQVSIGLPLRAAPARYRLRRWPICFVVLAMFLAGVAFPAEEAPVATEGATELTVEQAQEIVRRGESRVEVSASGISVDAALALGNIELVLRNVASITPEVADALGSRQGLSLDLPDLRSLSPEAAKGLARYPHRLWMPGLKSLSPAAAEFLAEKKQGILGVDGFTSLDPKAAAALARCPAWAGELKFLKTLDGETAAALAAKEGDLTLGVTTIEPAAALALAKHEKGRLLLPELATLTAEAAEALALCECWDGEVTKLNPLTPDVWAALAKRKGRLRFTAALSPAVATALAPHAGDLTVSFSGSNPLTPEVALALAGHRGRLSILSIPSLTPEIAGCLVKAQGDLSIDATCELAADAATVLAGFTHGLGLKVAGLGPGAAEALAAFRGPALSLNFAKGPADEVIGTLAPNERIKLGVRIWNKLSAPVVRYCLKRWEGQDAQFKRPLNIMADTVTPEGAAAIVADVPETLRVDLWLNDIPPEAAKQLARFRGPSLTIRNAFPLELETLDALLSSQRIRVDFGLINELSITTAELLAAREGFISLPGITSLESPDSIEIARALARKPGGLQLPSLRRLSPRTLSALIEKRDVRIPPLDSLEMIHNPDGSREDFLVPENFQQLPLTGR
jgi:hypothetical protein